MNSSPRVFFFQKITGVTRCVRACVCEIKSESRHSQMELISDKWVFEGFEMDAGLRVFVGVKVRDVCLKRGVDFGYDGIPYASDACPLPQLTVLHQGDSLVLQTSPGLRHGVTV